MNLLIFASLLIFGHSLQIQINTKPICLSIQSNEENAQLTVNYIVSGLDENQTDVYITKQDNDVLTKVQNTKDGRIREILKQSGKYYVCFVSSTNTFKVVSFDFDIEGLEKEYAQSEQFSQISTQIQETHKNFMNIYRNQHWISDRENTHAIILESTEKSVQWCAIIKIGVLVAISISQIFVVYNYFKDKDFSGSV